MTNLGKIRQYNTNSTKFSKNIKTKCIFLTNYDQIGGVKLVF